LTLLAATNQAKPQMRNKEIFTMQATATTHIELWAIDKLIFNARNPRKNDVAVDCRVASIREFGFKVSVLARSSGEVVDGQLRS
jgi:hypothetical protein